MNRASSSSVFAALAALPLALSLAACAQGRIVVEGGSSSGGSTGGQTSTGGSTGGTTMTTSTTSTGPCTTEAECASFGDACNKGACINGACSTLPSADGAPCDDGKQCTQNDTCLKGACVGGPLKTCPSSGPCTIGYCDTTIDACVQKPGNDGSFCNLGDPCVTLAGCVAGVCQPSQVKDCSYLNSVCGVGYCDPVKGCQAMPTNDGTPCDDNQFCTVNDQCVMGQCAGMPNPCGIQVNDPCKTATCNEAQKTCVVVPGNDGAVCDDGNTCTSGEKCSAGTCLGGQPANNGLACDDANGCTAGTSCVNGACGNAQSEIMACIDGDSCCPAGCANDKDCLYWASGVQTNVPVATLTGWTQCFQGPYDGSMQMSTLLQQCSGQKLLMACRPTGASALSVLAMGARADVLYDCGQSGNCSHDGNGVAWYYSDSYSWGFAPGGSPVNRNSCDIVDSQTYPGGGASDGDLRICWHSGGGFLASGWRCGKPDFLGSTYERLVFQAN
ncbi:MAG: hypothetical protein U0441_35110 [Polyangiaceae bacterium]